MLGSHDGAPCDGATQYEKDRLPPQIDHSI